MPQQGEALVESFLIIDQPRQRLGHWSHALSALDDRSAPPLALVRAYWDPTTEQALLNLAYDPFALGAEKLHYVVEIALLAEIGMIQPAELSIGDRKRFLEERLARCTLRVDTQRNVVNALTELVRQIRETRTGRTAIAAITATGSGSQPPVNVSMSPRGNTETPVLLVKAKGTRDDLVPAPPPIPQRGTRERIAMAPIRGTRDLAPPERAGSEPPVVLERVSRHHRAQTVVMPEEEARHLVAETLPPAPESSRRARSPSDFSTDQMVPIASQAATIYARYLRSGRWVPIRVGALSLKGAAMMAGALPRMNDHVDVALSFGGHRALVRGNVGKISSVEEAQASGAASFSVNFQLDDASRRQLTALLTAARAAKVTIKPPPPRAARRFPVEWPVALGTVKGVVKSDALDVSRDGLFVRPQHALMPGAVVNFSSVLDHGGAPVAGRARVVRHVTEAEARAAGLSPGYGLQIVEMGAQDRANWLAFMGRVERRADRRVLVGAGAQRLTEIQAELAAAGYAVTGGTDPGALVQLATGDARPVDAALIDAGWLSPQTSPEWVESLFSARNVPCVTLHGDPKRARATIDRLLLVA